MVMINRTTSPIRIILGSDHRGRDTLTQIASHLSQNGFSISLLEDCQSDILDYPDIAFRVASEVSVGNVDFGILICGTGIGMCVVANKFPGVRAAPCHNVVAAELSRKHNDANVLCLSGDMLGERSSLSIVEKWLSTDFMGGRHFVRLEKIKSLEERYTVTNEHSAVAEPSLS